MIVFFLSLHHINFKTKQYEKKHKNLARHFGHSFGGIGHFMHCQTSSNPVRYSMAYRLLHSLCWYFQISVHLQNGALHS